jgi:hypothetical protein
MGRNYLKGIIGDIVYPLIYAVDWIYVELQII